MNRPHVLAIAGSLLLTGAYWLGGRSQAADGKAPPAAAPAPRPLYHADANHLWNQLHTALMVRLGPDGKAYGHDRLEPLLWDQSEHLIDGPAADRLSAVLEEFLSTGAASAVDDPLKRAMLQRNLLQVAVWLAHRQGEAGSAAATAGNAKRLSLIAKAMHALALSPAQIGDLPDNYAAAVESKRFASRFDPDQPEQIYLPPDLFDPKGPWVCVGRTDGLTAPLHIASNTFPTSAFLVFMKLPAGREAGLAWLTQLRRQTKPLLLASIDPETGRTGKPTFNPETPALPQGTELALVRRAILVDSSGRLVASPITESVQFRVLSIDPKRAPREDVFPTSPKEIDLKQMAVFELQLRREALFAGRAGGLVDTSETPDFKTGFATHGFDMFSLKDSDGKTPPDFPRSVQQFSGRYACVACHRSPTVYGTMSFQRFSPSDEELSDASPPLFPVSAMAPAEVERTAVRWMSEQKWWAAVRKAME